MKANAKSCNESSLTMQMIRIACFNDKHEHLKSIFISAKSLQVLQRTAEKLTDKLLSGKSNNIKYCTYGEVPPSERESFYKKGQDDVSIILQ